MKYSAGFVNHWCLLKALLKHAYMYSTMPLIMHCRHMKLMFWAARGRAVNPTTVKMSKYPSLVIIHVYFLKLNFTVPVCYFICFFLILEFYQLTKTLNIPETGKQTWHQNGELIGTRQIVIAFLVAFGNLS